MNIKSVASLTLAILATFHLQLTTGLAQGTAFTYQGRLNDGTNPATGIYDLQFALFNAASGGTQQSGTFTQLAQGVTNGLFTVTLDFGSFFPGADRWLEIGVRTNGGSSFTTLTPRQKFTATPYAITAGTVTGVIPSAAISGVYTGAVTMSNLSNVFAGNGTGLTNVNAVTLGGISSSGFWKTNGNTGANPTNGAFLGNADNLPLELRVNGARGLRLEPTPNVTEVNVIGGSVGNRVINGAFGATVFGGSFDGSTNHGNTVAGNLGTVSGGRQNSANNAETTVAGGRANTANGGNSTVSGGYANTANGNYSGIGGGRGNLISLGVDDGVISGGWNNLILTNAARGTVGGGFTNVVSAVDATIAGGSYNNAQGFASAIAGGSANTAGATFATVGGGNQNLVATNADYATLAGGVGNVITNAAAFATISGGKNNRAAAVEATVSGGAFNSALGFSATVGGGGGNLASGDWSTIAGGRDNQLTNAPYATIGGGYQNVIQTNADYATIGGGGGNAILANGHFATVPGGRNNTATNYAFAAGNRAKANHLGTFVWGDATDADFTSTGLNQFLIRAAGGVGINNNDPNGAALAVNGHVTVAGIIYADALSAGSMTTPQVIAPKLNTTGTQPLEFFAAGQRGLRIEPTTALDTVNVIGGSSRNSVSAGVVGATIGGGGTGNLAGLGTAYTNAISSDYGTISGGAQNIIGTGSEFGFIGGGHYNTIQSNAYYSTIGGGFVNTIQFFGDYATIGEVIAIRFRDQPPARPSGAGC